MQKLHSAKSWVARLISKRQPEARNPIPVITPPSCAQAFCLRPFQHQAADNTPPLSATPYQKVECKCFASLFLIVPSAVPQDPMAVFSTILGTCLPEHLTLTPSPDCYTVGYPYWINITTGIHWHHQQLLAWQVPQLFLYLLYNKNLGESGHRPLWF